MTISLVLLLLMSIVIEVTTTYNANMILESEDLFIFPSMIQKALINIAPLKLNKEECLHIVVIGGSITCGEGDPKRGGGRGNRNLAWPFIFEKLLNKYVPCQSTETGNKHVVNNLCVGGVASDFWVERLLEWKLLENDVFLKTDLIFVDTATNDIFDIKDSSAPEIQDEKSINSNYLKRGVENQKDGTDNENFKRIKSLTEQIILLTRTQYRKSPSVVYLELSWNNVLENNRLVEKYDGPKSAVDQQLKVASYYSVPYISVLKAVTEDLAFNDFLTLYRVGDCCHITKVGAVLAANIILKALLALPSENGNVGGSNSNIPDPSKNNTLVAKFSNQADLNLVLYANPLVISTKCDDSDKIYLVQCSGWNYRAESNGKEGLITTDPKAVLIYRLTEDQVKTHLKVGAIHIQGLKSYEHMGAICIKLLSNNVMISEYYIDYLWEEKMSETFVDKIDFSEHLSKYKQSIEPRTTLTNFEIQISVCIQEEKASRMESKIKLFRISIF